MVVRTLLIMVDSMAVRESSVSPLSVRDAFNMMMIQCVCILIPVYALWNC